MGQVEANAGSLASGALAATTTVTEFILGAVIAIFCLFFFLKEGRRIWQWLRPRRSSSVDEVMVRSGLTLGEALAGLGELEELGLAEHLLDGWRRRSVS